MPLGKHLLMVTKILPCHWRNAVPLPPHVWAHLRLYIAFTPKFYSLSTLCTKQERCEYPQMQLKCAECVLSASYLTEADVKLMRTNHTAFQILKKKKKKTV